MLRDGDGIVFRRLGPDEGAVLTEAIEAAYGETYDVRWVYDAAEVSARLADGRYVSCVAETAGGRAALPHGDEPGGGRRRGRPLGPGGDDAGGARPAPLHPDQALPDGLGARARAWPGCTARRPPPTPTASGPTSSSGAHETGFLLGWIPASVSNDAAAGAPRRRQSAALFYTKLNDGHERAVYAPERHHEIVGQTLELCELRGTLAEPAGRLRRWRSGPSCTSRSTTTTTWP